MPKFELKQLCQLVERHKVTILMLVPPIALALARDPIATKYDLSSLRLVISGAAPLGPELEKELAGRLPKCEVIQAYGTLSHFRVSSTPIISSRLPRRTNSLGANDFAICSGLTESSPTTHVALSPYGRRGSIGPNLPMLRGRIVDPEVSYLSTKCIQARAQPLSLSFADE
jgi:acyl-CoA synthetase (AMP-forming)/AMP-acid ligase II